MDLYDCEYVIFKAATVGLVNLDLASGAAPAEPLLLVLFLLTEITTRK